VVVKAHVLFAVSGHHSLVESCACVAKYLIFKGGFLALSFLVYDSAQMQTGHIIGLTNTKKKKTNTKKKMTIFYGSLTCP